MRSSIKPPGSPARRQSPTRRCLQVATRSPALRRARGIPRRTRAGFAAEEVVCPQPAPCDCSSQFACPTRSDMSVTASPGEPQAQVVPSAGGRGWRRRSNASGSGCARHTAELGRREAGEDGLLPVAPRGESRLAGVELARPSRLARVRSKDRGPGFTSCARDRGQVAPCCLARKEADRGSFLRRGAEPFAASRAERWSRPPAIQWRHRVPASDQPERGAGTPDSGRPSRLRHPACAHRRTSRAFSPEVRDPVRDTFPSPSRPAPRSVYLPSTRGSELGRRRRRASPLPRRTWSSTYPRIFAHDQSMTASTGRGRASGALGAR